MNNVDAASHSWPDFSERLRAGAPLILPIGSFEQHGPHLPLATDSIIVEAIARGVAQRVSALILPTLPFGAPSRPRSGGGGDLFPAPATPLVPLIQTVEALADGAVNAGCQFLVVLSWHMENAAILWDALRGPAQRGTTTIVLFSAPWDYLDRELETALFPEGDPAWPADHAGLLETAVMRHLVPDLVGEPPAPVSFVPRRGYDVLPTPKDAAPATGVVLDARTVSAEVGERCMTAMIDGVASAIELELARR